MMTPIIQYLPISPVSNTLYTNIDKNGLDNTYYTISVIMARIKRFGVSLEEKLLAGLDKPVKSISSPTAVRPSVFLPADPVL